MSIVNFSIISYEFAPYLISISLKLLDTHSIIFPIHHVIYLFDSINLIFLDLLQLLHSFYLLHFISVSQDLSINSLLHLFSNVISFHYQIYLYSHIHLLNVQAFRVLPLVLILKFVSYLLINLLILIIYLNFYIIHSSTHFIYESSSLFKILLFDDHLNVLIIIIYRDLILNEFQIVLILIYLIFHIIYLNFTKSFLPLLIIFRNLPIFTLSCELYQIILIFLTFFAKIFFLSIIFILFYPLIMIQLFLNAL